jgi:hypothetical protein
MISSLPDDKPIPPEDIAGTPVDIPCPLAEIQTCQRTYWAHQKAYQVHQRTYQAHQFYIGAHTRPTIHSTPEDLPGQTEDIPGTLRVLPGPSRYTPVPPDCLPDLPEHKQAHKRTYMVECAGSSEDKFLFSEDTSIYCRPSDDLPANAMEIAISSKEHTVIS